MTGWVPTRVMLLSYASGQPAEAAEFRWSPAGGVTMRVIDPQWGVVAEEAMAKGVHNHEEQRLVTPAEGAAFMRTLVQPSLATYVRYVDRSPGRPQPGSGGGGLTIMQAYRFLAGLPIDPPEAGPPEPPVARTDAEAQLYMDLHPCERCGSVHTPWDSGTVFIGGEPARAYAGSCDKCGTPRRFEFVMPGTAAPQPGARWPDFGGEEPSQLLDPGEWLWVADLTARKGPAGHPGGARRSLSIAAAAMQEVLKFIPGDGPRVPAEAFRSERGREVYAAEPGRFERDRLTTVRDSYRTALAQLDDQEAG